MAVLYAGEDKTLKRVASPEKIVGKWKEVVDTIVETSKLHLDLHLIAIYIGGSVGTGMAKENKSDVDSYVVVDLSKDEIEQLYDAWVDEERRRIHRLFPFLRGVEIHFSPLNEMTEGRKFQLKVLSAHVYGKDISARLPEYKLDKETIGRIRVNVAKDLKKARRELSETTEKTKIQRIGSWIAKRLIRSSGMLVLWKGNVFTMDIEPLVELLISHYPEQAQSVQTLLDYTNEAPTEKKEILCMLDVYGQWLVQEDREVFG